MVAAGHFFLCLLLGMWGAAAAFKCTDSLSIASGLSSSSPFVPTLFHIPTSSTPRMNLEHPSAEFVLPRILQPARRPAAALIGGPALGKVCLELWTESLVPVRRTLDAIASSRIPAEVSIFTSNASVEAETKNVLDQRPVTDVAIHLLNRNGGVSGNAKVTLKAKDNSRWRTMIVNHVGILPPFAFQVGQAVVGADIDTINLFAQKIDVHVDYKLVWTFAALSEELIGGKTDLSTQSNHVIQQLRLGLENSCYLQKAETGFTYLLPGRVDRYLTLVSPFTMMVWGMLFLSIIVMIAFFNLAGNFDIKMPNFQKLTIASASLIIESMPFHYLLVRHSHKAMYLVLYVWLILSALLSKAYQSTLLASLVAVTYEDPIDTWQELLDNNIFVPLTNVSTITNKLQYSSDEALRRVYKELLVIYDGFVAPQWVEEAQEKGTAAALTTDFLMLGTRHRRLMSVGRLTSTYSGFLYSLKYPYKEEIDWILVAFHELGIYKKLRSKYEWGMTRPERDHERNAAEAPPGFAVDGGGGTKTRLSNSLGLVSFSALAPQHLAPSLLLASGLLVVAGVAFLLELAYKKSRRAMDAENVALEMGDKAWS